MKVRIDSISPNKDEDAGHLGAQKSSSDRSRFAFLVTMIDRSNGTKVDTHFDEAHWGGSKSPVFGTYEMWFTAEESTKLIDRLEQSKLRNLEVIFEFTCTTTSFSVLTIDYDNDIARQQCIINADRFAPMSITTVPSGDAKLLLREEFKTRVKNDLCLTCNSPVLQQRNRKDEHLFFGCSQWSLGHCKGAREITCPKCNLAMKEKPKKAGGTFLGCTGWPRCNGGRNIREELELDVWRKRIARERAKYNRDSDTSQSLDEMAQDWGWANWSAFSESRE